MTECFLEILEMFDGDEFQALETALCYLWTFTSSRY